MTTCGANYSEVTTFPELVGKTWTKVEANRPGSGWSDRRQADELLFLDSTGAGFRFDHDQDCCESVRIEDVIGDLSDLEHSPILFAEEVSTEGAPMPEDPESYTWTFYRFGTAKGTVTVRWLGESNGYYSERVRFSPVAP
jgi:hypothetical protein